MYKKMKCMLLRMPDDMLDSVDFASQLLTGNRSETIRTAILFYINYFKSTELEKLMSLKQERLDYCIRNKIRTENEIKKELFL